MVEVDSGDIKPAPAEVRKQEILDADVLISYQGLKTSCCSTLSKALRIFSSVCSLSECSINFYAYVAKRLTLDDVVIG